MPQEHVSKGQSPENAQAEAPVKELKIRTCDLVQPESMWKDSVRARTGQEDVTASAKSVAGAGAEECEVDQFGQSMARGHVIEVTRLASRLERRSSWCVKETLGTWRCCCRRQGCRGTVRRQIQRSSSECDASSLAGFQHSR